MRLLTNLNRTLLAISIFAVSGCLFSSTEYAHLEKAEQFSRQQKIDEAIGEYIKHIDVRLNFKERPEWENPFFYYLLIGDLELKRSNVAEALKSYELAESKGVDKVLISDRFRFVASWYENNGKLKEAIETLRQYRDRDPLLFDAVMDRLAKKLTALEDTGQLTPTATTTVEPTATSTPP